MAKRKINAAMILAAGEDAHLQTKEKVSHAKQDVVLKRTSKKLTLNVNLNELSDEKKNELEIEITKVLNKYIGA